MDSEKYVSGKRVPKRPIKNAESLPQILNRLVAFLEEIDRSASDENQSTPHNWYGDATLYQKEFDKRYQKLKLQNPKKEDLLKQLVEMEMLVMYENHLNVLLIRSYAASREGIFQSHAIATQSARNRLEAKERKFDRQRHSAIEIINQIRDLKGQIHQNDYGIYIIKVNKLASTLSKSTARKYWLDETGFKSTKKIDIT